MKRSPILAQRLASVVSSQWLMDRLATGSSVKILETSLVDARKEFESSSLPGARYYDLSQCAGRSRFIPSDLPDPQCLQKQMQDLGVCRNDPLIIYDRGSMLWSARAWWTLRLFGHYNVSVLNGGFKKWTMDEFPTEPGSSHVEIPGDFTVNRMNTDLIKYFPDMVELSESEDFSRQIIDARKNEHYRGDEQEPSESTKKAYERISKPPPDFLHRGHVPGAINLFENLLVDPDTNCLLPDEQIIQLFQRHNIDLSLPITTMCYNGFAACVVALAAAKINKKDVSVYYGSWTEYGQCAKKEQVTKGPGNNPVPAAG